MKKTDEPLVTLITPIFNAEKYLKLTIDSVLAQTYKNFEYLLIVDAKCSDQSLKIAQSEASKDTRLKCISTPSTCGVSSNRNRGLDLAKGDWICFLDADDLLAPEKIATQLNFNTEQNVHFSFTSFFRMSADGKHLSQPSAVPNTLDYWDLLRFNPIACHTALIHRDWIQNLRFREVHHEDFAFWLDVLRPAKDTAIPKKIALGLNLPLAYYRSVPGSRAHNKLKAALWRWQILRHDERLPILAAVQYFISYAFIALRSQRKTKV